MTTTQESAVPGTRENPSKPQEETDNERWISWLGRNLLKGCDPKELVVRMVVEGVRPHRARAILHDVESHPLFHAARATLVEARKREAYDRVQARLYRQSGYASKPVRAEMTGAEFYEKFYFRNLAVVVRGLMKDWPALSMWSPESLAERFGSVEVEVNADRDADPRFEDNFLAHKTHMAFGEFIAAISRTGAGNDIYLTAKNRLLENPAFACLFDEIITPGDFLDPEKVHDGNTKLWIGPAGTVTPMHHDQSNVFLGQVYGRKRIVLIPPFFARWLYNDRHCYSDVDPSDLDLERFPDVAQVAMIDIVLEPGEFVLIPVGWWHWVKSLEMSISLGCQNFYNDGSQIVWDLSGK